MAPLVTLGDRPPQVEGNGGGLNYSAWTWAALGLLMSPDTLCESPPNPPPAYLSLPCACRSMCVMSNTGCSITQEKKTGDKKTPLSGAHGLSMCVHVQKKERFVLKREGDFKCFSVYSSLACRDF